MSIKSIIFSILSVLVFSGLLFVTVFILFGMNTILGIVGVIVTAVVTSALTGAAVKSSKGFIDKLLAKIIVPIVIILIIGGLLLKLFAF